MRNVLFLIVCFFYISFVSTQENVLNLKLEECIERAAAGSLDAFKAKNLYLSGYWGYRSCKAGWNIRIATIGADRRNFQSEYGLELFEKCRRIGIYKPVPSGCGKHRFHHPDCRLGNPERTAQHGKKQLESNETSVMSAIT